MSEQPTCQQLLLEALRADEQVTMTRAFNNKTTRQYSLLQGLDPEATALYTQCLHVLRNAKLQEEEGMSLVLGTCEALYMKVGSPVIVRVRCVLVS
jgi:hypothetical protein